MPAMDTDLATNIFELPLIQIPDDSSKPCDDLNPRQNSQTPPSISESDSDSYVDESALSSNTSDHDKDEITDEINVPTVVTNTLQSMDLGESFTLETIGCSTRDMRLQGLVVMLEGITRLGEVKGFEMRSMDGHHNVEVVCTRVR